MKGSSAAACGTRCGVAATRSPLSKSCSAERTAFGGSDEAR
jgi:hypothetical protein